jgi:ABC-type transporter Mla subunit MlaD
MSIKARDVRVNIAEVGFERGVVHSLESAIEEINALRSNLRDAAEVISNMVDQMDRFMNISEGIQSKLNMLERNTKEDDTT